MRNLRCSALPLLFLLLSAQPALAQLRVEVMGGWLTIPGSGFARGFQQRVNDLHVAPASGPAITSDIPDLFLSIDVAPSELSFGFTKGTLRGQTRQLLVDRHPLSAEHAVRSTAVTVGYAPSPWFSFTAGPALHRVSVTMPFNAEYVDAAKATKLGFTAGVNAKMLRRDGLFFGLQLHYRHVGNVNVDFARGVAGPGASNQARMPFSHLALGIGGGFELDFSRGRRGP